MTNTDVLMFDDLYVGRVDATKYGYSRGTLKVTIDVEVKRAGRTRETTEHDQIENPLSFSMSCGVWNQRETDITSGGQNCEVLNDLTVFADGFDAEKAARLVELWQRWHLNTMRAGCAHVEPVYTTDQYKRRVVDMDATPACPVNRGTEREPDHYRYGRAWLTEPLPEGFTDTIRANLPDKTADTNDPDSPSLAALMARDGIGATVSRRVQAPRRSTFGDADWWNVIFRRPGVKSTMTIPFAMGKGHNGRRPTPVKVFSNLLEESRMFEDARDRNELAGNLGMEPDSKEFKHVYKQLEAHAARLRGFLADLYDEYAEQD